MQNEKTENALHYRAILNPLIFNNAHFWKEITAYMNGYLEEKVIKAEQMIKSNIIERFQLKAISDSNDGDASINVCYPNLVDLIYLLCGNRIPLRCRREEEAAIQSILISSIRDNPLYKQQITHLIEHNIMFYGGNSIRVPPTERPYSENTSPSNLYPGFIGHRDFVLPPVKQRPISDNFWLSVILMTIGVATLICAFAFMHAASLAVGSLLVAGVGVAALLGGVSIFRSDLKDIRNYNEKIATETAEWRPAY